MNELYILAIGIAVGFVMSRAIFPIKKDYFSNVEKIDKRELFEDIEFNNLLGLLLTSKHINISFDHDIYIDTGKASAFILMRQPLVKDFMEIKDISDEHEQTIMLISRICAIKKEFLYQMAQEDFAKLTSAASDWRINYMKTT